MRSPSTPNSASTLKGAIWVLASAAMRWVSAHPIALAKRAMLARRREFRELGCGCMFEWRGVETGWADKSGDPDGEQRSLSRRSAPAGRCGFRSRFLSASVDVARVTDRVKNSGSNQRATAGSRNREILVRANVDPGQNLTISATTRSPGVVRPLAGERVDFWTIQSRRNRMSLTAARVIYDATPNGSDI